MLVPVSDKKKEPLFKPQKSDIFKCWGPLPANQPDHFESTFYHNAILITYSPSSCCVISNPAVSSAADTRSALMESVILSKSNEPKKANTDTDTNAIR